MIDDSLDLDRFTPAGSDQVSLFPVRPIGEAVSRGDRASTGVVSHDLVLLVFLVFTGPLHHCTMIVP